MTRNSSMKTRLCCLAQTVIMAFSVLACAPLFTSNTDDRIESAARQSYVFRTYLKEDDITIRVGNGVATLTGTVFDESHKFLAGDIVASLPGIAAVENKLILKSESPVVNTDAWLVSKVKSTLSYHRNVDAAGTEVIARHGAVILRGKAGSMAQKDLTTEYVKDIEGVKNVQNEITVSSAVLLPGEKPMGQTINVKAEVIDDASITVMVEMMLLNHRSTGSLTPIVLTKDGLVRLRGDARNAAKKELVGKYASDVHGVKRVINHMSFE